MTTVFSAEWLAKAIASPSEMRLVQRLGKYHEIESEGVRISYYRLLDHIYLDRVHLKEQDPDPLRGE